MKFLNVIMSCCTILIAVTLAVLVSQTVLKPDSLNTSSKGVPKVRVISADSYKDFETYLNNFLSEDNVEVISVSFNNMQTSYGNFSQAYVLYYGESEDDKNE